MSGKQMEGDNTERRKLAKAARDAGRKPSEVGATLGASKQRQRAASGMTHQQRLDLKREGKHTVTAASTPTARPRNRDGDTPDRESHPRL
ncbi:MAG TPA: hypothetical protein VEZ47_06840 [Gemmatirosa sp.]|jgi:hypothetical protein|nr:hypothetical protein [Gemmatirosa sp.]